MQFDVTKKLVEKFRDFISGQQLKFNSNVRGC